jgi:hypothetical protein
MSTTPERQNLLFHEIAHCQSITQQSSKEAPHHSSSPFRFLPRIPTGILISDFPQETDRVVGADRRTRIGQGATVQPLLFHRWVPPPRKINSENLALKKNK